MIFYEGVQGDVFLKIDPGAKIYRDYRGNLQMGVLVIGVSDLLVLVPCDLVLVCEAIRTLPLQ